MMHERSYHALMIEAPSKKHQSTLSGEGRDHDIMMTIQLSKVEKVKDDMKKIK